MIQHASVHVDTHILTLKVGLWGLCGIGCGLKNGMNSALSGLCLSEVSNNDKQMY